MRIYTMGNKENPEIMLLPGTCSNWKGNFDTVLNLLIQDFYVICVSYDGFDESENTEFLSMNDEVAKIEEYILREHDGHIFATYGSSLGGTFVGLLVQRNRIHMEHGILGSSDLDQGSALLGKIQGGIMIPMLTKAIHTGKLPWILDNWLKSMYSEEEMNRVYLCLGIKEGGSDYISKESIYNQYYTDLVTKLDSQIYVEVTTIHCFYAKKMGKKYLKRYKKYFKDPDIVEFDLGHEQLLMSYPEKWVDEVKRATRMKEVRSDEAISVC